MIFAQVPAEQKAHSQKLIARIQAIIKDKGGWIGFDEYMQLALYAPGLGYYVAGLSKFGAAGDFITAPELGALFGRCLASQTSEVLENLKDGSILEFGAGSGALAASVLNELAATGPLPAEYLILELSGELRARQRETILLHAPAQINRVKWLDRLPDAFEGVVLANEVLDAIPATVFEQDSSGAVFEMGVTIEKDATANDVFCWRRQPAGDKLEQSVKALALCREAEVYRSELQFQASAWINSLAGFVNKGVVLLIDYGFAQAEFYHPDRNAGTLVCHYRHHVHDNPFILPGLQDITTHLDFTAMASSAKHAGFDLMAYTTQGEFLLSAGLLDKIATDLAVKEQLMLAHEVKKLSMPHEMGELFKVLAFSQNYTRSLSGFSQQNKLHRLVEVK